MIGGYKTLASILLIVLFVTVVSAAATPEQIRQLELDIKKIYAKMHKTRSQYGRLQGLLQHSEEEIGELAQRIETLLNALTDKQYTLAKLKKQQFTLQTQLKKQRQVLARQIRAAYLMGRQDYLKLWLNQEEPFTIGRVLTYYDYFNRARTRQIAEIKTTLYNLSSLQHTIVLKKTDLNQLIIKQSQKKKELELKQTERKKILVQLTNTLESQVNEIKRLQENKLQLEALLGTLKYALKDIPKPPGLHKIFAQLKGQLHYPVQGRVIKRFGNRLISDLKWQGMLIGAQRGEKIRVIAAGRVAFAQWFRNLGLLVIVDHGEGYMSLYAHNQSLYVKTGDWVEANNIIATVGNSGGRKISALYFEIRHQGVPQPPRIWLNQ